MCDAQLEPIDHLTQVAPPQPILITPVESAEAHEVISEEGVNGQNQVQKLMTLGNHNQQQQERDPYDIFDDDEETDNAGDARPDTYESGNTTHKEDEQRDSDGIHLSVSNASSITASSRLLHLSVPTPPIRPDLLVPTPSTPPPSVLYMDPEQYTKGKCLNDDYQFVSSLF
jgi:hypothetical protein